MDKILSVGRIFLRMDGSLLKGGGFVCFETRHVTCCNDADMLVVVTVKWFLVGSLAAVAVLNK